MDPSAKTNMEDIYMELVRRSNDFMERSVKAGKPLSFKEFPQRQKFASANIQQVLDQMRARTD
jgi:hypothetical protein